MSKLILSFEGTVLKTFPVNRDRITIGRRPDNDIQVDNLAVSGQHAVINTVHNDSILEDLNSTNGTLVNGELVQKRLLQHNDVIEIGKHAIKFLVENPAAGSYNFAKTMVIKRPDNLKPAAAHEAPAPMPNTIQATTQGADNQETVIGDARAAIAAAAVEPLREGALKILSGGAAGRVLELTKSLTTVGKAGLQVAVFTKRPIGYFVTHVEGETFPLCNGQPLGKQARQLNEHDMLEIAGIKMQFFFKN